MTIEERFWSKVDKRGPDECWPWTGTKDTSGRGRLAFKRKNYIASRLAWQFTHKRELGDLYACHSCDNPICVNPAHLWAGTSRDNWRDAFDKKRLVRVTRPGQKLDTTHCLRGHPFDQANTYLKTTPRGRVLRVCRACKCAAAAEYYRRRKSAQPSWRLKS